MTTRSRGTSLCLGVFSVVLFAAATSRGQDPGTSKSEPIPAKRKFDPSRRVPSYFGQIALSAEQRESIYKIRRSHIDKIESLKKEIEKIEVQMMHECEGVLSDTQKKLLENLRSSGTSNTKESKSSGSTVKATTPAKKS